MAALSRSKGMLIVCLIGLVFALPMIAAQLWRPEGATANYGQLVDPARPIENIDFIDGDAQTKSLTSLNGKWTLLHVGEQSCAESCQQSLYKIERVRLAQSKNIPRVQSIYFVPDQVSLSEMKERIKPYQGVAAYRLNSDDHLTLKSQLSLQGQYSPGIYLLDPLGNWLMFYHQGADPSGIRRDLKKLLKISQIG